MQSRQQLTGLLVSTVALACAPLLLWRGVTGVTAASTGFGNEYHLRRHAPDRTAGNLSRTRKGLAGPAHRSQLQDGSELLVDETVSDGEAREAGDKDIRKLPDVRGVKRAIFGAWLANAGLPFLGALTLTYGLLRLGGSLYDRHHVKRVNEATAGDQLVRNLLRQRRNRKASQATPPQ